MSYILILKSTKKLSPLVSRTFIRLRHFPSKPPHEDQGTDAPGGCSLIMKYGVSLQSRDCRDIRPVSGETELKMSQQQFIFLTNDQCSSKSVNCQLSCVGWCHYPWLWVTAPPLVSLFRPRVLSMSCHIGSSPPALPTTGHSTSLYTRRGQDLEFTTVPNFFELTRLTVGRVKP